MVLGDLPVSLAVFLFVYCPIVLTKHPWLHPKERVAWDMQCKCGCGQTVRRGRVFVDKEHQLTWMSAGGAREIAALQPIEDKQRGGRVAGEQAAKAGRLMEAAAKGGARSREIAEAVRAKGRRRGGE